MRVTAWLVGQVAGLVNRQGVDHFDHRHPERVRPACAIATRWRASDLCWALEG
jgi:hypothetical protein